MQKVNVKPYESTTVDGKVVVTAYEVLVADKRKSVYKLLEVPKYDNDRRIEHRLQLRAKDVNMTIYKKAGRGKRVYLIVFADTNQTVIREEQLCTLDMLKGFIAAYEGIRK